MPLRSNEVRSVRDERIQHITTPLTVSVIGCVVNGPGDARETDIGLTGGGSGTHQVYISGPTEKEGCRFKDKERGQIRQVGEGGAQQQKDRRIVDPPQTPGFPPVLLDLLYLWLPSAVLGSP